MAKNRFQTVRLAVVSSGWRVWLSAVVILLLFVFAVVIPEVAGMLSTQASSSSAFTDVMERRLVHPLGYDSNGVFHLLGTDAFGRDIFVRLWQAARVSLGVGVLGSALSAVIGVILGSLAAWNKGVVEKVILSVADALLSIPRLVLLLVIAALWGPGLTVVVSVLALTGWMSVMRLVRSDVAGVLVQPYIESARALGVPSFRMLAKHVLPNALGAATVAATLGVGNAILLESGLSFLGLGIQPPVASWGNMISGGREWLLVAPWIALIPGVLLIVTIVACTILGDAINDKREAAPLRQRAASSPNV